MSYWVQNTKKDKTIRHFDIDGEKLERLREKFQVYSVKGTAVPCERGRGLLYMKKKKLWRFVFWRPQLVVLADDRNLDHSYDVVFDSLDFYQAYRELCLENERKFTPSVGLSNIKVCYDGESIAPVKTQSETPKAEQKPAVPTLPSAP